MSSLQRPDINPGHSANPYYVSQDKWGPPLESVLRGPRIGPYFVAFDPKQEVIPDMEFLDLYSHHNIFPPSALRHYLLSYGFKDDILMEPPTFAHLASNLVHYLIAANEAEMDPCRTLDYYYGFLSFRSLVHSTCVTVLKITGVLPRVVKQLYPTIGWGEASNLYALAASDQAEKAAASVDDWRDFCEIFLSVEFIPNDVQKSTYAIGECLLKLLFQAREMLLVLYARGLIPGCSLVLFAISIMLFKEVDSNDPESEMEMLEDLGFRLYLVGSPADRMVLQLVCMIAIKHKSCWRMPCPKRLASADDDMEICRAYSALLGGWKRDNVCTKSIPVELLDHMASFVLAVSMIQSTACVPDWISIFGTCLEVLWFILDDGRLIDAHACAALRQYMINALVLLAALLQNLANEYQAHAAELLKNVGIVPLCGRLLLLVPSGNEMHDLDQPYHFLYQANHLLDSVINSRTTPSPGLYKDYVTELVKSSTHLADRLEMKEVPERKGFVMTTSGLEYPGNACIPGVGGMTLEIFW
ncbi:MYND Zn-finger protein [Ceratobasidium sp. AG-Ba]|nr:MYND Zn-finger protein [Ceratobasidium sp. AG-Ba]